MDTTPPITKAKVESTPEQAEVSAPVEKTHPLPKDVTPNKSSELYATYDLDHSAPYLAEHFGIEGLWDHPDLSYKTEVNQLNDYLMQEIREKNLDNSVAAVKDRLAKLEKQAGIDKSTSVELKVKLLAEHAKYLTRLNDIRLGVRFNASE